MYKRTQGKVQTQAGERTKAGKVTKLRQGNGYGTAGKDTVRQKKNVRMQTRKGAYTGWQRKAQRQAKKDTKVDKEWHKGRLVKAQRQAAKEYTKAERKMHNRQAGSATRQQS